MNARDSFSATETLIARGQPVPPMGLSGERFARFQQQWVIFFASVASMQEHPGAGQRGHVRKDMRECARVADEMLSELIERLERS